MRVDCPNCRNMMRDDNDCATISADQYATANQWTEMMPDDYEDREQGFAGFVWRCSRCGHVLIELFDSDQSDRETRVTIRHRKRTTASAPSDQAL